MMNKVIEVKNLTKSFKLFHSNKDRLINIIPFINKKFDMHTSLNNISFDVKKGELYLTRAKAKTIDGYFYKHFSSKKK